MPLTLGYPTLICKALAEVLNREGNRPFVRYHDHESGA
jgi:hypothetical protein